MIERKNHEEHEKLPEAHDTQQVFRDLRFFVISWVKQPFDASFMILQGTVSIAGDRTAAQRSTAVEPCPG